ncbi:MAG TPA: glycoside hydrolase family 2 TIM barrel-domain containing protein [Planctomycetota bacterium]|nr:glycoside hydrolase family 2 TIM barrel-domain containing protein [Planctomycetota bacterium]
MGGGRARPILRSLALFVGLGSLAACGAPAPSAPAGPAPTRETHDLGGPWEVWLDREGVGLRDDWVAALTAGRRPAGAPGQPLTLGVPGPLEADSATLDYDGIAFYVRRFEAPPGAEGSRGLLRFGQVNYACRVWLDGAPVGEHEGGYEAFSFDLTGRLGPGPHVLVVRVVDPGAEPVDGLTLAATPHAKESWYENSGGLLGPVSLELVRGWSLREGSLTVLVDATAGQERVMLSGELLAPPGGHAAEAPFALRLRPADGAEDSGRRIEQRLAVSGQATPFFVELWARGAARWSPESPALHRITLHAGGELVAERTIGFRTLSIEGGDFRIDGVRRTLKGVLWQPHHTGTGGVTPPDDELRATARAIRETGFDLVRAHVRPAPPAFLDECDRIGLLVLEEPAIGWVQDDPGLRERLLREVSWMVERDRHHPAIVLWGVLNELSGQAWRHADALVERVASLDGTRPVLEDSGAFLGQGRVRPPGAAASIPMIDRHAYPPYPLPIEERDALLGLRGLEGGLVFVSEFGYGALLDTEAALRPFTEAGKMFLGGGCGVDFSTASICSIWPESRAFANLLSW